MAMRGVSHVELFVRDKVSTVRHLVSSLGFTHVADCVEVDRSSALLRRGHVQVLATSGWATGAFIARNGEGVAGVAVTCDDVPSAVRGARALGAEVSVLAHGGATVTGIGDVAHTLLSADGHDPGAPPVGRRWVPRDGAWPAVGGAWALERVTLRLPAALRERYTIFCGRVFGIERHPSQRSSLYSASAGVTFALEEQGAPVPSGPPTRAAGSPVAEGVTAYGLAFRALPAPVLR
ncbi:VOC family protein [Streptomyces sp. BV129]|uniref:VOC family protein n=1 Tax=Streptomyces sp. BV129 TaxID=2849671 RepID=UPI001C2EEAED|nr:VOC family protein [Streptomyces sp. BV129]MBV1945472.1 VOC family protein [Streptomyces sp. BV129]